MRIVIISIALILSLQNYCFAAKEDGCTKSLNEKYSFGDFTHKSFKDQPTKDFDNSCIKGSCFYQESKYGEEEVVKDIFPDGIKGVEFVRCNLDNVLIPADNTVDKRSSKNKVQVQNDLDDWILNDDKTPKEPMNKESRIELGISVDSKDIPIIKMTKEEKKSYEEAIHNNSN